MSNPDVAANVFSKAEGGLGRDARAQRQGPPTAWEEVLTVPPGSAPIPWDKRAFDVTVSLVLLLLLWPIIIVTGLLLLIVEGRPIFYVAERMATPHQSFRQIKFRTMHVGADAVGGVSGGDKTRSISRLHRFMRRSRLDELPQLWNVLKGDMSLVGPRPPLRRYVDAYPELYGRVLRCRPGLTGLATLRFHAHEERLLAACATAEETEAVYRRACIKRKARLDLLYQRRRTLWLDIVLVAQTAVRPFRHPFQASSTGRVRMTRAMRRMRQAGRLI